MLGSFLKILVPITYNDLNYGGANWYAKTVVNIQVYLGTFID